MSKFKTSWQFLCSINFANLSFQTKVGAKTVTACVLPLFDPTFLLLWNLLGLVLTHKQFLRASCHWLAPPSLLRNL